MKRCKKCGTYIDEKEVFCHVCGTKVDGLVSPSDTILPNEGNIAFAIILTIITCGIYGLFWIAKLNDDVIALTKEDGPSGVAVVLLSIITCGIYLLFWSYKLGSRIDMLKGNLNANSNILYLILSFIGLDIINLCLAQDVVNNIVRKIER